MDRHFPRFHLPHPTPAVRAALVAVGVSVVACIGISMAVSAHRARIAWQEDNAARVNLLPVATLEPLMPSYGAPAAPRADVPAPSDTEIRRARNLAPELPSARDEMARQAPSPPGTDTEAPAPKDLRGD